MLNSSDNTRDFGSNCELILTSTKGDGQVSLEAFEAFYQLMVTYRYPMRYLEENQKIIQNLSIEEKKLLEKDELAFIKEKFNKEYPAYAKDMKIETIPKSLYQLHAYAVDLVSYIENEKNNQTFNNLRLHWEWEGKKTEQIPFEKFCYQKLFNKETCQYHFQVNNKFIKRRNEVKEALVQKNPSEITEKDIIHQYLQNIKTQFTNLNDDEDAIDILQSLGPDRIRIYAYLTSKQRSNSFVSFIEDMTLYEWESRKTPNVTFLYQGKSQDINKRTARQGGHSHSYGDGFLGGGIYDADTAMAYSYVAGKKGAYNFSITKVEKHLSESSEDAIYNPRVTSLLNLHGRGEFHHARSKVAQKYDFSKHSGIEQGQDHTKDKLHFLVSQNVEENESMEKALTDYQKSNSVELLSKHHHGDKGVFSLYEEKESSSKKSKSFETIHKDIHNRKHILHELKKSETSSHFQKESIQPRVQREKPPKKPTK